MMEMIYQVKQNTEDIAELKKKNNILEEKVELLEQRLAFYIQHQPTPINSDTFEF